MDVIGFGALNLDEIYAVVSLPSLPGIPLESGSETTIDEATYEELERRLRDAGAIKSVSAGGQAANAMYALARMGFRTALMGAAGHDAEGEAIVSASAPVDTSQVVRGGRSARCVIILEDGGERTIRVLPATGQPPLDAVRAWQALGGAPYLHLTSLAPVERLAEQKALLESIPDEVRVSFDPGELYCRLGVGALSRVLERTHALFVTEREAEMLAGRPLPECREALVAAGPRVVVWKMGARGVEAVSAAGERAEVPGKTVEAVDTTGAGDVLAAGFLAGLLLGLDLRGCAELGVAAAAESVRGYGRSSYPGRELLKSMGAGLSNRAQGRMKR